MKRYVTYSLAALLTLGAFIGLLISPEEATEAAKSTLALCAMTIVPSLFPFMVVAHLIMKLGLAERLEKVLDPFSRKVLGISGAGASVFLLGLAGGYPLGAYAVSDLYVGGAISKSEANNLNRFCNNCGPAFIVSVAGSAVFRSVAVGYFLLVIHAVSAFAVALTSRKSVTTAPRTASPVSENISSAFTESVKRASLSCLSVCGFVTFFGVLTGLLDAWNVFPTVCANLAIKTGMEYHFIRSLMHGILEIGGGIGSMAGLSVNALNLAMCSFLLAWGSFSVQAQAAAAIKEGGLSPMPHLFGKLLHGGFAALLTLIAYPLFF